MKFIYLFISLFLLIDIQAVYAMKKLFSGFSQDFLVTLREA